MSLERSQGDEGGGEERGSSSTRVANLSFLSLLLFFFRVEYCLTQQMCWISTVTMATVLPSMIHLSYYFSFVYLFF